MNRIQLLLMLVTPKKHLARCYVPSKRSPRRWFSLVLALTALFSLVVIHPDANGANTAAGTVVTLMAAESVHTAGSYNAYTGSTYRTVTDLVVPGSVGAYPLVFTRISSSRYDLGEDFDKRAFGPAGCWRHNYNWMVVYDNSLGGLYRVNYPNGKVVHFGTSTQQVASPTGGAAPPQDPFMRSVAPGLQDRLELQGNGNLMLHLKDGGRVLFTCLSGTGSSALFQASWISDPYNYRTTFTYYPSGATFAGNLQTITEPAGRWLQITYKPFSGKTVIDTVTASSGQSVTYGYDNYISPNNQPWNRLRTATYNNDINPASNKPYLASYTYQDDNTGGGGRPLLLTCDDPYFAGPMPRIRYGFAQGSSAVYGQIAAEIDDASGANPVAVSSYTQSSLTESTGTGTNGNFTYYQNSYLLNTKSDYQGNVDTYAYDANSYLNSVLDRNGKNVTITRDPYVGKPMTISRQDANGQNLVTTLDYGSTPSIPYPTAPYWLMKVTDPRGYPTVYTRDANHQVKEIDYPDGTYETFGYNGYGKVTTHRKTDASVDTFIYYSSGELQKYTNSFNSPANCYTLYYYDSLDRLSQVTDFNNHSTFYSYNARHQITQIKHHDGTHVDYTYDDYGNRTTVSDERQKVTTIGYDKHRRPTSIQVPVDGSNNVYRTTTFTYERGTDSTGNAHTKKGFGTMTLPSGKKFHRVYSSNGLLKQLTKGYLSPDATTTSYAYTNIDKLWKVTDANGIVQATYGYDFLNRKGQLTDANGHVTTWNYYPANDPSGFAGLLASVIKPGVTKGSTLTTTYSGYDSMGRLGTTVDPKGNHVGRAYDAYGRLQTISDNNGGYVYGYDAISRIKSLSFPDGTAQLWSYDPAGNEYQYTNRAGFVRTSQYDSRNRRGRYDWNDGLTSYKIWTWDDASRLKELRNFKADMQFTYDDSGLMLSEQNQNFEVGSKPINTTGFTYDVDGNVAAIQYPTGDLPPYSYDGQNRCNGLGNSSFVFSALYFQGDQLSGRALANNTATQYYYQPNNRISSLWHHHGGNDPSFSGFPTTNISNREYGYARPMDK